MCSFISTEARGASEDKKFAAKLTPAETDSSDYFGITSSQRV
jgi:hypothetical protein